VIRKDSGQRTIDVTEARPVLVGRIPVKQTFAADDGGAVWFLVRRP
jgi:hypothetical protein